LGSDLEVPLSSSPGTGQSLKYLAIQDLTPTGLSSSPGTGQSLKYPAIQDLTPTGRQFKI
jgi:hypothetical protein